MDHKSHRIGEKNGLVWFWNKFSPCFSFFRPRNHFSSYFRTIAYASFHWFFALVICQPIGVNFQFENRPELKSLYQQDGKYIHAQRIEIDFRTILDLYISFTRRFIPPMVLIGYWLPVQNLPWISNSQYNFCSLWWSFVKILPINISGQILIDIEPMNFIFWYHFFNFDFAI